MINEVADIAGYAVTLTGVFYIYKSYLFIWLLPKGIYKIHAITGTMGPASAGKRRP
jgi:hypothetical protein